MRLGTRKLSTSSGRINKVYTRDADLPDGAQQNSLSKEKAEMFAEQMLPRARERLATVNAAAPVQEAADLMSKPHTDLVVVCGHDGGMVGVLTKTDIVGQIRHCIGGGCTSRVDTIMTRDVVSCRPSDALHDIWSVMRARGLQRIPVVDQSGKPIGIIYARDALQSLLNKVKNDEVLLHDYMMNIEYQ